MKTHSPLRGALLTALVASCGLALPATAQTFFDPLDGPGSFSNERLQPATDREGIFDTESGSVHQHLDHDVALWGGYALNPLVVWSRAQDGTATRVGSVVSHKVGANLVGQLSLFDWVALGLDVPVTLFQTGDDVAGTGTPAAFGLGDLRFIPKIRLLHQDDSEVNVAIVPTFTVHTALPSAAYLGEGFVTFAPKIALSREFERFRFAANVGLLVRPEKTLLATTYGPAFTYSAGVGYKLHPVGVPLGLDVGMSGSAQITPNSQGQGLQPLELLAGAYYDIWGPLQVFAGAGASVLTAPGTPDARLFAGVRYSGRAALDKDEDGINDDKDVCPDVAEDKDGFEDADGCPDADNDNDGIADGADKCPDEAEDKDGFEDADGCPDTDNDGDEVPDTADKCPDVAEDRDGHEDDDGCIDPDNDGDGIADGDDKCPNEAEDKDGNADDDGCVDPDDDGDGIPDTEDKCPNEAEDKDGHQDDDGCVDPDNDLDGVADADDKCPNEKEIINGVDDNDGCPDKGKPKVIVTKERIEILDKVYFETGKADIKPRSFSLLEQVAAVLRANPDITKVRVEGHTDSVGEAGSNKSLSDRRAKSVASFLVNKGVPDGRLTAVGYGEEKPVADNKTASGREQNRRVEFRIVEFQGKAMESTVVETETTKTVEE